MRKIQVIDRPNPLSHWLAVDYQVLKVSPKFIRKAPSKTMWAATVAGKIKVINRGNSSINFQIAYLLGCLLVQRKKVNIWMKLSPWHRIIVQDNLKCNFTINNLKITNMKMLTIAKLINTCKVTEGAHVQKYSLCILYKKGDPASRLL